MKTDLESLWVFALFSRASHERVAWLALLAALAFLATALSHWAHPGGPAWGRHRKPRSPVARAIPGPRGLPVVGSLSLMSGLAHRRLAAAAKSARATRLMAISLGETRAVITCHPDVAREILNASCFADRPVKESAYRLMFDRAIGFAPYGVYWRTLRRIAANHLFCPKQIKASEAQRADIASQMVGALSDGADAATVTVRDVLKRASLSNMMCSVFGELYGLDGMAELRKLVDQGYELLGVLNWSDHLPWMADFDAQRVKLRCSKLVPKVNRFVGQIVDEHRDRRATGDQQRTQDFVDVLLSLQGDDRLSDSDMIAVLWEMIFRGTDTVAVLIEWILARMVLHQDIQLTVHSELDRVVGASRAVAESDMSELPYLTAVIKETLRLHPPGPLLSWARLATADTTIDGHHVPKGTTAMVNMWAISQDLEFWTDPLAFNPSRFLKGGSDPEFSVFGSDLRLAPFGAGRRVCPGKNLGLTTVSFWVASLLHEFQWLPAGHGGGVDFSEVLRLSCEMANPLSATVCPRLGAINATN